MMATRARSLATAIAATLLISALTGCTSVAATQQPAPMAMSDAMFPPFDHIHGFGIDEKTGIGYVATHTGLYQLPPFGSLSVSATSLSGPIGGQKLDLMGFVIRGAYEFASGHPALQTNASPDLGLIERTGDDEKWRTVALGGSTDFHDLDVITNPVGPFTVLGYDANTSTVNVSHDGGATWSKGAVLELRDLTADAHAPGVVYATTAGGLMLSTDYGAHWNPDPGAPLLYLVESLSSPAGGALVGVDVKQHIWTKTASTNWRITGTLKGRADALAYSPSSAGVLLANDNRGIIVSHDLGVTWKVVVRK